MTTCRLILDSQPQIGTWNMALDEALLESAVQFAGCAVRIYRWSEPTVSLGYFQKPGELDPSSPLNSLPQVRRLTGGGAILHHHEWTYSCIVPSGHPSIRVPGELYAALHRRIIAVLSEHGITANLRCHADTKNDALHTPASPFLCFFRGDPNDIVLNGRKIVGSAQRRRKGAVLQHGSILLRRSEFAPDIPGIADLSPDFEPSESLGEQFCRAIAKLFAENVIESEPTANELRFAAASLEEMSVDMAIQSDRNCE